MLATSRTIAQVCHDFQVAAAVHWQVCWSNLPVNGSTGGPMPLARRPHGGAPITVWIAPCLDAGLMEGPRGRLTQDPESESVVSHGPGRGWRIRTKSR